MSGELSKSGSTHLALKLAKTLEEACGIRTKQAFLIWAERELRLLIPHQLLICGKLEFGRAGVNIHSLVRHEYERASVPRVEYGDEARLLLLLVRGWARSAKPQLFRQQLVPVPSPVEEHAQLCLPTPIVLHGLFDTTGRGASFVALCGVDSAVNSRHVKLLELVVPHMHMALTALLRGQRGKTVPADTTVQSAQTQAIPRISLREREVMQWLQGGKTNWEIAQILGKSEHTVKNQVRSLLVKLQVRNRAQAVAKMSEVEVF